MPSDALCAAVDLYDSDNDLHARLAAMYQHDRAQLITALLWLAYDQGCDRTDAVAFANAITAKLRAEALTDD